MKGGFNRKGAGEAEKVEKTVGEMNRIPKTDFCVMNQI